MRARWLERSYRVVRVGGIVRAAVPDRPRRVRIRGLAVYMPYRFRARAAWHVVRIAAAMGLLPVAGPPVPADLVRGLEEAESLLRRSLHAAWYFPPEARPTKCVGLLVDDLGRAAAILKAAWAEGRRLSLERERQGLSALAAVGGRSFRVPELLSHGGDERISWLLRTPLPEGSRRTPSKWSPEVAAFWQELRERTGGRVAPTSAPWWNGTWLGEAPWSLVAEHLRRAVPLEIAFAHGDLVPWNVRTMDGRLWLFDLEHFDTAAPALWDPLSFFFTVEFLLRRRSVEAVARRLPAFVRLLGDPSLRTEDLLFALAYGRARAARHPRFVPTAEQITAVAARLPELGQPWSRPYLTPTR